jgi:hypothetical protein
MTRDPLVVNTRDGACWERRAVTSDGHGLYAAAGSCRCPEFLLVPLSELAEHGIVSLADALPVPAGDGTPVKAGDRVEIVAVQPYEITWDDAGDWCVGESGVLVAVNGAAVAENAATGTYESAPYRVRLHSGETVSAADVRPMPQAEEPQTDPIPLRWGLNDVEWCDDNNTIVLLSGPQGEPYTLELEPTQATVLREDLAGPDGPAAWRAAWDTEQCGPLYGREEAARSHCEHDARLDYPAGTQLVWRAYEEDVAVLVTVVDGREEPTGYTVTRQPLAAEYVADEPETGGA